MNGWLFGVPGGYVGRGPSQDASDKWKFSLESPILNMWCHPGGRGPHPKDMLVPEPHLQPLKTGWKRWFPSIFPFVKIREPSSNWNVASKKDIFSIRFQAKGYASEQWKKGPWLFRVYVGDETLSGYVGIIS